MTEPTSLGAHDLILIDLVLSYPRYASVVHRPTCTWTARWIGQWRVGVDPLLFGAARLLVDDGAGLEIEDSWHYPSIEAAFAAAQAWAGPYPGSEPQGWTRNPTTGRRRDASGREWVQW